MTKATKDAAWQKFVGAATPKLWRLRVAIVRLDDAAATQEVPTETTVAFPEDRDVAAAIARHLHEPGSYRVSPIARSRGPAAVDERKRLLAGAPLPRALVVVTAEHCAAVAAAGAADPAAAPAAPRRGPSAMDPDVADARRRADVAEARRREAEAAAAARRAERQESGGDQGPMLSLLRTFLERQAPAPSATPDGSILAVLQQQAQQTQTLLLAMLEQARQRETQLLRALEEARRPTGDAELPELGGVKRTIELFTAIREMMDRPDLRREPSEPRDLTTTIVEQFAPLLPQLLGMRAPAAGAAATANPAATPETPAKQSVRFFEPEPPPAGSLPGASRVHAFVARVVTEAANGSDPDAVADGLADDVGLLPLPLRAALDVGDAKRMLAVARSYLAPEAATALDELLRSTPSAMTWLDQFALAMAIESPAPAAAEGEA